MKLLTATLLQRFREIGSQEDRTDPLVIAKYFTPDANWTWYAIEYDEEQRMFFGLVDGQEVELGYFSLIELEYARGALGLPAERDLHFDEDLLKSLEKEWVEFKKNNTDPQEIGEYISALANAAKLHQKPNAYLIWGVDNDSREIVGTTFKPYEQKAQGNSDLIPWLTAKLAPRLHFHIEEIQFESGRVIVFDISVPADQPVCFNKESFIRVGSAKKRLQEYPEKARVLWSRFGRGIEKEIIKQNVSAEEVLKLLDYQTYFRLLKEEVPNSESAILERLGSENLIINKGDSFHITFLGAILFAVNLENFEELNRKGVKVTTYKGRNRLHTQKERIGQRGYVVGFETLLDYIVSQIPEEESFEDNVRKTTLPFPRISIREFVANALVHQDFIQGKGSAVSVEIFEDRIEITNPGLPLIETDRFLDHPPKSRNEHLTDMMRRMGICEERGSGVDRAMVAVELQKLPPVEFETGDDYTKVVLLRYKPLNQMTEFEKIRACYWHCCIQWIVHREPMKNESLSERLNVDEKNKAIVSRIIKEAREKGLIKPFDPDSNTRKHAKYLPYWQ